MRYQAPLHLVDSSKELRSKALNVQCCKLTDTLLHSLYGDGEELIGKWFKKTGHRKDIFLATKFGFVKGSQKFEVNSSGEYCKKACEASLQAFGIDTIDLCMCPHAHKPQDQAFLHSLRCLF